MKKFEVTYKIEGVTEPVVIGPHDSVREALAEALTALRLGVSVYDVHVQPVVEPDVEALTPRAKTRDIRRPPTEPPQ